MADDVLSLAIDEVHGAETDRRHLHAGAAERSVLQRNRLPAVDRPVRWGVLAIGWQVQDLGGEERHYIAHDIPHYEDSHRRLFGVHQGNVMVAASHHSVQGEGLASSDKMPEAGVIG